jgi:hypothetical protein
MAEDFNAPLQDFAEYMWWNYYWTPIFWSG